MKNTSGLSRGIIVDYFPTFYASLNRFLFTFSQCISQTSSNVFFTLLASFFVIVLLVTLVPHITFNTLPHLAHTIHISHLSITLPPDRTRNFIRLAGTEFNMPFWMRKGERVDRGPDVGFGVGAVCRVCGLGPGLLVIMVAGSSGGIGLQYGLR